MWDTAALLMLISKYRPAIIEGVKVLIIVIVFSIMINLHAE